MPCKGRGNPFNAKRIVKYLDEWGRGSVTLKSDGEPAIVDLKRAVKEIRVEDTRREEAPKGDKAANGEAEQAVQEVAGLVRTVKCEMEDRMRRRVNVKCDAFQWVFEHVAAMITR